MKYNVHVFDINIKSKTIARMFIYKMSGTLQKQDNLRSVFIYKNKDTLHYAIFHENFEVGMYIKKAWNFALRDVLYTKIQTFRKKQDTLRYVFIYKNPDTLHLPIYR